MVPSSILGTKWVVVKKTYFLENKFISQLEKLTTSSFINADDVEKFLFLHCKVSRVISKSKHLTQVWSLPPMVCPTSDY
jgi:hypothetical protein